MIRIPAAVRELGSVFERAGKQCYLVGGAVRDMLLGRGTEDFDIATDADPREVSALFRRVIPTGIEHGTVTVLFRDSRFEVTTFRTEGRYTDGRRPDQVSYVPSIDEDLKRRDFTINAIAIDVSTGECVDRHEGRADLRARVIRAIGDADERFREDGLRLMRACRLATQLGFSVEPATREAMRRSRDAIRPVSAERVREEIEKMLRQERPSGGLELMRDSGILEIVLPELARCVGVEQRGAHCHDVWGHAVASCDAAPADNAAVRLAALLHDVGKPPAAVRSAEGEWTFHRHDELGAEIAEGILRRLKYPNATIAAVRHLVASHMFHYTPDWTDAAVRRFVARVGEESIPDLIDLRRADQIGTCGDAGIPAGLVELSRRVEALRDSRAAFTVGDLAVDGKQVMAELGIRPGPLVGIVLGELLETVLDDPSLNTPDALLGIARRFYERRLKPAP
jgi:tRNA nucleotidyltransferase (CCA-adding enzyme)